MEKALSFIVWQIKHHLGESIKSVVCGVQTLLNLLMGRKVTLYSDGICCIKLRTAESWTELDFLNPN